MGASEVAVGETLAFLDAALPRARGRLLEVGCGKGEVAAGLVERGFEVTALDSSDEAVAAARARGVAARAGRFPELPGHDGAPFDAVLFARSLHHIPALGPTLDRARELLRPGGVLVVEDFAWERVDRSTAVWGYGLLGAFASAGLLPEGEWDAHGDALATWRRQHEDEGLHTGERMLSEIGARFDRASSEPAPYFYRYFSRHLEDHGRGAEISGRVLAAERELIAAGGIAPLGLRITARRPEHG